MLIFSNSGKGGLACPLSYIEILINLLNSDNGRISSKKDSWDNIFGNRNIYRRIVRI